MSPRLLVRLLPSLALVLAAACEDSAPFTSSLTGGDAAGPDTGVTRLDAAPPLEDAFAPARDGTRPAGDARRPLADAEAGDASSAPGDGSVAPPGDGSVGPPVDAGGAGGGDGRPSGDAVVGPGADVAVGPGADAVVGPGADAVVGPGADAVIGPGSDAAASPDAISGADVIVSPDALVSPDAAIGPAPDAAVGPSPDAQVGPAPDGFIGPPPDAAVGPTPDVFIAPDPDAAPPPPAPERVCCLADAECAAGQHCSGGRCWDPAPVAPCDCPAPCAAGTACVSDDLSCGQCVPVAALCTPACERELTRAPWYYLAPDPPQNGQPLDLLGTLVSDERLPGGVGRHIEIQRGDGRRFGYAYILPARVAFPFRIGDTVHLELSAVQVPGFETRSAASGPEGVRLAVVERRGADPTSYLDLPFHIEYQGCGPTLIGNCLQQSPATLVFDVAGARSPVLNTGDSGAVGDWTVHVSRVYRDENACAPEMHDLYANFVMVAAPD